MKAFLFTFISISMLLACGCAKKESDDLKVTFRTLSVLTSKNLPKIAEFDQPVVSKLPSGELLIHAKIFATGLLLVDKTKGWIEVKGDKTIVCYSTKYYEPSPDEDLASIGYDLFLEYRVSGLPSEKLKNIALSSECKIGQ